MPGDSRIILLDHGSGGRLMHELIAEHVRCLDGAGPEELNDAAVLELEGGRLAFTTDSFVISPLFFPGGDIGSLAVYGTVNDLAMMGARPLALGLALVIAEGLEREQLTDIIQSIGRACELVGVRVVTGDTKVVERGAADGLFVNTSGLGLIAEGVDLGPHRVQAGDRILVSGTLADHGMAVMAARHGLRVADDLGSDSAPLWPLVEQLLQAVGPHLHCLRDPTRGGLASSLNEIACQSHLEIAVDQRGIPVRPSVQHVCQLLGLDPLLVANEGKLVALVAEAAVDQALAAMRAHPLGRQAALIGRVQEGVAGRVLLRTALGTDRILDLPAGQLLPRIC